MQTLQQEIRHLRRRRHIGRNSLVAALALVLILLFGINFWFFDAIKKAAQEQLDAADKQTLVELREAERKLNHLRELPVSNDPIARVIAAQRLEKAKNVVKRKKWWLTIFQNLENLASYLKPILAILTGLASLAAIVFAWRQDSRETRKSKLEIKKLELEIAKLTVSSTG